ncbi:mRNA-decapping enzyme-like protein isoform X2 [Hordeum vulgare subsp. vulgare]|uniref:mRNA-decapping enzyme-like protein isoform X2 n=1 Tax=Hordeum vulgare subsp. vulgare TaxID=112509 RepID=UPI001D1A57BB|nr:mRNA-decapping enzyme-like protein isoform X2 [Hordeum vulgare subsp. vulgare]
MKRRGGGGGGRRSKVTPNLGADREGTRLLNLTVLRRLDPAVADILITAASVTAYSFDQDTARWSHKGVEGSLFVVKRNTQPRFQFLVMNRRNTENLVEDLLDGFEYQAEVPYIIYRNAASEIIGIWFYEPEECGEVVHIFSRIHKAYSRASPKKMVPSVQSDFEELEVASDVPSSEEDTLEQPTTSSSMVPGSVGYKLFPALITAAACVGAPTGGAGPVQPNQPIRAVPSSRHASPAPSAVSSQPPASHNLLPPSRALSATMVPPDAHVPTSAPTIQAASLTKLPFFPPIPTTSPQATTAHAAFPSSAPPPFLPPLVIQHQQSATPFLQPFPLPSAPPPLDPPHRQSAPLPQQPFAQSTAPPPLDPQHRQSAPLAQPFTQSTAPPALDPQQRQSAPLFKPFQLSSAPPPPRPQHWQRSPSLDHFARPAECPPPPYGALLLQPFPPPNPPPPLLAPTASYGPEILSRDKLRGALLRLVQNDDFIDMLYREIVKG